LLSAVHDHGAPTPTLAENAPKSAAYTRTVEQAAVEAIRQAKAKLQPARGGDTSLAEDLAQDAFLHFTTGKPSLDEISDLDKYLYVVLKNLFRSHLASMSRRCAVPFDPLAHENAMKTWRSIDPERRLTLRDELRRICVFACERKETSKGASAFLLHFFHGLSVADVSVVMQTTRGAVDERLSVARKEARRWLSRPAPVLVRSGSAEADLMTELQSMIASTCRGECFSTDDIRRCYAPDAAELPRDRLAHVASCSKCLGLVAELLQFPRGPGSPPSAIASDRGRISRWRRKRADLLSTEPSELRLIVNGHLLATERVRSPDSDFSVSVSLHEPLEFVEIWSGETIRLLFLSGISEPPDGKFDHEASLDLNGRRLQLNLRFTDPWPTIGISYQSTASENPVAAWERGDVPSLSVPRQRGGESHRFPFRLSIPAFSTVIALALIFVVLFMQTRETTLGAAELLNRAEGWERSITTAQARVLHRWSSLVKQARGAPMQRTFVDVWRQGGANVKLSRWTDAAGRLLAEARVDPRDLPRLDPGNIWQFEPSADSFLAVAGPLGLASVSRADGQMIIRTRFAQLVLDRATNRPIEERFSLDATEYVFTESATETMPSTGWPSLPAAGADSMGRRLRGAIRPSREEFAAQNTDSQVEERELQVRRELHALELASAAAVLRDGNMIDVRTAPTSAEQEQQLTLALNKIPGIKLSFLSTQAAVLHATGIGSVPVEAPAGRKLAEPLASKWLKIDLGSESAALGEEEKRIDAARRLVSLAAEWRVLSERYPLTAERPLSAEARATLAEIVNDLRERIRREVDDERAALTRLLRMVPAAPNPIVFDQPCETWQSQAVRAADLIWENERAIDDFYAPTAAGGVALSDSESLRKLRSLSDALESIVQGPCN
jgi:DNA-directed RNA polymerase specialized sigma24 family protein